MEDNSFSWEQLGDIKTGRPNLGQTTTVEVYRLMEYTMRLVLNNELGADIANKLLYQAGELSGKAFCIHYLDQSLSLNKFLAQVHEKYLEHAIGILNVEKADPEKLNFIVTISEDLDCSGLPVTGNTVCKYDEGFLAGIFNTYTGKYFEVKEIDCWATGSKTCRFRIRIK
ncbi:MAG: V4R domain-containing protein [Bacteroidales bacterium]|nr:V4R domain-containing protein [Bacteroidales bacterium]